MPEIKEKIEKLAKKYSDNLNIKVQERVREMADDKQMIIRAIIWYIEF